MTMNLPESVSNLRAKIFKSENVGLQSAFKEFVGLLKIPCFEGAQVLIEFPLSRYWISANSDFDIRIYGAKKQAPVRDHLSSTSLKYHLLRNTKVDVVDEINLANSRQIGKIEHGLFLKITGGKFVRTEHPYDLLPTKISSEVSDFITAARDSVEILDDETIPTLARIDAIHDLILAACLEGRLGLLKPKWRARAATDLGYDELPKKIDTLAKNLSWCPQTVANLKQTLSQLESKNRDVRWARWYALDCLDDYDLALEKGEAVTALLCLSDAVKHSVACLESNFNYNCLGDSVRRLNIEVKDR